MSQRKNALIFNIANNNKIRKYVVKIPKIILRRFTHFAMPCKSDFIDSFRVIPIFFGIQDSFFIHNDIPKFRSTLV